MDGNGRWATRRGLTRIQGHRRGKDSVRAIVEKARELGIEYLTWYAFSSETWQRPEREVGALMPLLRRYLRSEVAKMMRYGIRLRAIGNLRKLPPAVLAEMREVERKTARNDRMTVLLAVSYGSREEITRAARALARRVRDGALAPEDIDEDAFAAALGTAGIPDPDLLIRTSGEMRLSNFLLWQLAYTELYVTGIGAYNKGNQSFNFRSPITRSAVDVNGVVHTLSRNSAFANPYYLTPCPANNATCPTGGFVQDDNVFFFSELYPAGFTPRFVGVAKERWGVAGWRGELENGLTWDVSGTMAKNTLTLSMYNSLSPTFGPQSQTEFQGLNQVDHDKFVVHMLH